jgi:magnesium transporter
MSFSVEYYIDKINQYAQLQDKNGQEKMTEFFIDIRNLHPADIADILENINPTILVYLFFLLLPEQKADVFMEFSEEKRRFIFVHSSKSKREDLLQYLTVDELVDFFDELSDQEVELYAKLLNKKRKEQVLSRLEFPETSAAGIMESNIVVLSENITVAKTISLLKKVKANKKLYQTLYVVDSKQFILGYVFLEDLVLAEEEENISSLLRRIKHSINAHEDQEEIASFMTHYRLNIVPVVDDEKHFLGVITSEIIARAIEDEASEDILKMANLGKIEHTYFETKFSQLLTQRAIVLGLLLLLQSVSAMIIGKYNFILEGFLVAYIGMITSTGGNTSSQVCTLAIQGITTGSIKVRNMIRFVKREMRVAFCLGLILGFIGMLRIYFLHYDFSESLIIGIALFCVIILSTLLGSTIPFLLQKIKLDPAYSAGPFLATCMDILGVIIFTCVVFFTKKILF